VGPVNYYKKTIYIQMLDNILKDIKDRFAEQLTKFFDINILIPTILATLDESALLQKINRISFKSAFARI
jgi:hypothetical protein